MLERTNLLWQGVFAVVIASTAGCGNDDGACEKTGLSAEECSGGDDNCLMPTFTSIHGLLSSSRCANSGCHASAGVAVSGSLDLSGTPAEVLSRLVGIATVDAEGLMSFPLRVEAGRPETSYLLHMVESDAPVGSLLGRMPPGTPLADCDIEAVRMWIQSGAQND